MISHLDSFLVLSDKKNTKPSVLFDENYKEVFTCIYAQQSVISVGTRKSRWLLKLHLQFTVFLTERLFSNFGHLRCVCILNGKGCRESKLSSLRGQTVHSLYFKRNPQQAKSDLSRNPQHCYFSLIFCAVSESTNKYLNHCTAQNSSNIGDFAESATFLGESRTV